MAPLAVAAMTFLWVRARYPRLLQPSAQGAEPFPWREQLWPLQKRVAVTWAANYAFLNAPTLLVEYAPELRAIESNWPKIHFHPLREHAGLVFQQRMGD